MSAWLFDTWFGIRLGRVLCAFRIHTVSCRGNKKCAERRWGLSS